MDQKEVAEEVHEEMDVEEKVPFSKLKFWHINVHVHGKKMYISIGLLVFM